MGNHVRKISLCFVSVGVLSASACGSDESDDPQPPEEPLGTAQSALVGVPVDGYPNYNERLMLTAINRARADPNVIGETASSCSGPRTAQPPLMHNQDGARASRFHCANSILNGGGLSHNSYCSLDPNVGTTFEAGCNGDASCACLPATAHFTCTTGGGSGTGFSTRASYFGFSASAEVGAAGYGNGWSAVYGWLSECRPSDGHRTILTSGSYDEIGLGHFTSSPACWTRLYFGALGTSGPAPYRLPAGAHRPETGTNFDFYVNYYDPGGAPQSAQVVIDGVCAPLALDVGTASNGTYHANVSVSSGCHQYWFLVSDSTGTSYTYPEAGAWGVGNCTGYDPVAMAAGCQDCTNGATQPCGVGECAGTQSCSGGSWGTCNGSSPTAETCNGLDDDCDGTVDDGDPGGGGTCNTGMQGICSAGTEQCQSGSLGCVADNTASTESCNGLDDDCDGTVDDGNPGGGANCNTGMPGVCATGTQQCQNGSLSCVQSNTASAETCNGLDDDCNGTIDDGNPGGGSSCNTGLLGSCASGTDSVRAAA